MHSSDSLATPPVDRDTKHLPMDVFEFLLVLATEVADGAVVDGAARDEPHETDGIYRLNRQPERGRRWPTCRMRELTWS